MCENILHILRCVTFISLTIATIAVTSTIVVIAERDIEKSAYLIIFNICYSLILTVDFANLIILQFPRVRIATYIITMTVYTPLVIALLLTVGLILFQTTFSVFFALLLSNGTMFLLRFNELTHVNRSIAWEVKGVPTFL